MLPNLARDFAEVNKIKDFQIGDHPRYPGEPNKITCILKFWELFPGPVRETDETMARGSDGGDVERSLPINAGFEDGEREPAVKKCVWPPEAGKGNKKKFFPRASRKDNRHVNPIIQGDPCQTSEFYISALWAFYPSLISLSRAGVSSQHLRMHVILLCSPGYLGWSPIWRSLILFTFSKSLLPS